MVIVIDELHKTTPFLSRNMKKQEILGQRAKQINSGSSRPFIKINQNMI